MSSLTSGVGYRVGADVGGTFTDITIEKQETGEIVHVKVPTVADQPALGVVEGLERAGVFGGELTTLAHGTTVAINAVIQKRGARTGIITNKGFRDILELRRGARTHILDPLMDKPAGFVPRRWRLGISGRLNWKGDVLEPIEEREVLNALDFFTSQGVESIAICLLHSYVNPAHELQVRDILLREDPELYVTTSSEIVSEAQEYERTSTAALNAYCQPVVSRYLSRLEFELRERGFKDEVLVMQSNGGLLPSSSARQRPINILESGPAAGALGAGYVCGNMGAEDVVAFDMGGTTAKAAVIEAGEAVSTSEYELFEEHDKPGSGWPIRVPMVDIVEIGSGGGSIARVDDSRRLTVGPISAGSSPGPVCYKQGGTEPTFTDAQVALGVLRSLIGGSFSLDVDGANEAIETQIADPLGLSVADAALGIVQVSAAMASDLIREVTIARGRDPRDFVLAAYGGAGPMIAAYIMKELDMKRAVIPRAPGNFSAYGLMCTDLVRDAVRSMACELTEDSFTEAAEHNLKMASGLYADLGGESEEANFEVSSALDLRYQGQFHRLTVPVEFPTTERRGDSWQDALERFHSEHKRKYTYTLDDTPVEVVNVRTRVTQLLGRPSLALKPSSGERTPSEKVREVYLGEERGWETVPVVQRSVIPVGEKIEGPAIIEELTSTTFVAEDITASPDANGNLVLERTQSN